MKQTVKRTNKVFTIPQLVKVMPLLKGDRKQAIAAGKKNGITSTCFVDCIRTLLGYTNERPEKYSEEQVQQIIDLFQDNPDKSIYQIFNENKQNICATDYQAMYRILKDRGFEVNRKRNFWTPIKEKRLIYFRDELHYTFKQIADYFGEGRTAGNVSLRYYILKGKRKH